jgi:hypothetical protein
MPFLPNYYASHQWLREIRRGSGHSHSNIIAVDFRLPSNELVLVGHFSKPKTELTISEAAKLIISAQDPQGYEVFLPRSVNPTEIHKIRSISQVIGWRYYPKAKGNEPCVCDVCVRGEYGANKLRRRFDRHDEKPKSKMQIMKILSVGQDSNAMAEALYELGTKRRGNPEELEFLLNHPSSEVLYALAHTLEIYRGKRAIALLRQLANHPNDEVQRGANESLLRKKTSDAP